MSTQFKRVICIGSGGVGFWLITALNRSLPHGIELIAYDADSFEGGLGHSRLPRVSNPATKKVNFLKGYIQMVMGDKAPAVYSVMFDGGGGQCQAGDLVVDCSDMPLERRKIIWDTAQQMGAKLIRVSYDGLNETVVVAQGLPLAHKGSHGYRSAPNTALSYMAGGIGALAVLRVLSGYDQHIEFQISLSEYFAQEPLEAEIGVRSGIEAEKQSEGILEQSKAH